MREKAEYFLWTLLMNSILTFKISFYLVCCHRSIARLKSDDMYLNGVMKPPDSGTTQQQGDFLSFVMILIFWFWFEKTIFSHILFRENNLQHCIFSTKPRNTMSLKQSIQTFNDMYYLICTSNTMYFFKLDLHLFWSPYFLQSKGLLLVACRSLFFLN